MTETEQSRFDDWVAELKSAGADVSTRTVRDRSVSVMVATAIMPDGTRCKYGIWLG